MQHMGHEMGVRRFGRFNWLGTRTLAEREIRRFMAVWQQTVLAPLITTGLFLAVFALAIGPARGPVMGVAFLNFLAPGLMMMTVIQNGFANASSSIVSAKVQGNIVDTLMPPLSAGELVLGYLAGSVARGILVSLVLGLVMVAVLGQGVAHPVWVMVFVLLGGAFMGGLGIAVGIYSGKFDQMAAVNNFVITPLSFLSGTFYSVETLPAFFRAAIHVNPIFYLIDGARYGFIGRSDASPWLGLGVCLVSTALVLALAWHWFRKGYRMKS